MDYSEIFKEINYLTYLTAFIKWGAIFLLVGIIILIVGYKFNLFKRNYKTANILAKAYYVIIPLYFLVFSFKFAPIRNTHKELNSIIDSYKNVISLYTTNFLNVLSADSLKIYNSSIKDVVDNYINNYIKENQNTEDSNNKIGAKIINKVKTKVEYNFLKQVVEKAIIEEASGFIGIDKSSGKKIYRTSLKNLFKEGELLNIFKDQINKVFKGFYKTLLITFLIGLSIPTIEIIAAKTIKY